MWLCMADPSNDPDHPGWPLRNMLLLAAKRWQVTTLSVLCVRDQRGSLDASRSLCLSVVLPPIASGAPRPLQVSQVGRVVYAGLNSCWSSCTYQVDTDAGYTCSVPLANRIVRFMCRRVRSVQCSM